MKKLILSALAIAAMAGCSKQESSNENSNVIRLTAGVSNAAKAPINTWAGTEVAFASGVAAGTYTGAWDATVASSGEVSLLPERLYHATDTYYLKGYTPRGTFSNGEVIFSGMDGTQDILLSDERSGSLLSKFTDNFAFAHKLAQLNFTVKCDAAYGTGKKLTSITVNGTQLPVSMKISNGVITYDNAASPISAFNNEQLITQTTSAPFAEVLVQPEAAVTVTVVANGKTYTNIPVNITGGGLPKEATAYTIAIAINGDNVISLKANITPWKPGSGDVDITSQYN